MSAPSDSPELALPPPPVPREPLPIHYAVMAVIARHRAIFGRGPRLKDIANACRWRRADDAAPVLEEMHRRALVEWDGADWSSLRISGHGSRWF